jgi:haloalkane dehalogenase
MKQLVLLCAVVVGAACVQPLVVTAPSKDCLAEPMTQKTATGIEFVRTPEACFEKLPDWNYEAKYVDIDGLRQAYVDVGPADGQPILLLHGQPSWSYLYRFMIPGLVKNGYRVIAMDHLGMGRSDKPVALSYHSFQNHLTRLDQFIGKLGLTKLTLFCQDWGSVLGLYLASQKPAVFSRIVLGNGGLPSYEKVLEMPKDVDAAARSFGSMLNMVPRKQPYFYDENGKSTFGGGGDMDGNAAFANWIAFAMHSTEFQPSMMLEALTFDELTPDELAAYNAPFPSRITMAAPRTFPSLINQLVGISGPAKESLKTYRGPFLTIVGGNEPGVPAEVQNWFIDNVPGAKGQKHHRYRDASHYLQDDKGADIAERVSAFIKDNPL